MSKMMKMTLFSGIAMLLLASLSAVPVLGSNMDASNWPSLMTFLPASKPGFCFNANNAMDVSFTSTSMVIYPTAARGVAFPSTVVSSTYSSANWIVAVCDMCNNPSTASLKMVQLTVYTRKAKEGNVCVYTSAAKKLPGITALTAAAVNAAWAKSTLPITPVDSSGVDGYGVYDLQVSTGTLTYQNSQASLAYNGACVYGVHSVEDITLVNPYINGTILGGSIAASSFRYMDSASTPTSSSRIVTACIYNDASASKCTKSSSADENKNIVMLRVDITLTYGMACAKVVAVRTISDATYFPPDGDLKSESLWDSEASNSASGYQLESFGMYTAYAAWSFWFMSTSNAYNRCSPATTVLDLTIEKPFMNGSYVSDGIYRNDKGTAGVAFPSTQSGDTLSTTQAYWIFAICEGCVAGKGGGSIKMVKVLAHLANENACVVAESAKYLPNPTSSDVLTPQIVNDAWSKAPSSNKMNIVEFLDGSGIRIQAWTMYPDHPHPKSSITNFACLNRVGIKADVLSSKAGITTAQQCAAECDKVAKCKSFTLGFNDICYLQSKTFTGKEGSNGLNARYRTSCISQGDDIGLSTATSAGYTCIKNYNVRGTLVKTLTASTLAACTKACDKDAACKYLVYSGSSCSMMKDAYTGNYGGPTGYSTSVTAACFFTWN